MAHNRIACPSCKAKFRVVTAPRHRAVRCPRCRVRFVLCSTVDTTKAVLTPAITHGVPQQAPAYPKRVTPVNDTAVDMPTSGPTRWDLHALVLGSSGQ